MPGFHRAGIQEAASTTSGQPTEDLEHIWGIVMLAKGESYLIRGTVGTKVTVMLIKEHMFE